MKFTSLVEMAIPHVIPNSHNYLIETARNNIMKQQYNPDDHAQHIYETRLDDFFNYLATQNDLYEALWCMFDEEKEYKHAGCTRAMIKHNKWKLQVYRLLEVGNKHAWLLLTEFAKSERESNEWDIAASKVDDLR